jgi:hypothetical protein
MYHRCSGIVRDVFAMRALRLFFSSSQGSDERPIQKRQRTMALAFPMIAAFLGFGFDKPSALKRAF